MANCKGAGLSPLGMSALGGALGDASGAFGAALGSAGAGLANVAKSISNSLPVGAISNHMSALSGLQGVATNFTDVSSLTNALTQVTSSIPSFLQSAGSALNQGFGAISGALGETFSSIGGDSFLDGLSTHATDLFGSSVTEAMQAFDASEVFSTISQEIAGPLTSALGAEFGQTISSLTQALPVSGDVGNFLGKSIPDMQALVTNGLSTLTNVVSDIPGFASDLGNLGSAFDLNDITNFGNPGQLVGKLIGAGAGGITGITSALQEVGLEVSNSGQIANLAGGQFNGVVNDALSMITNPEMIQNAQSILGSNLSGLSSMADFTNLRTVMPVSFSKIPFDTFSELREQLSNVDLGALSTPKQLGEVLTATTVALLPTIGNSGLPYDINALTNLGNKFLGSSGPNNSILVSDLIGSLGGIGLSSHATLYKAAIVEMDNLGALNTLRDMYTELQNGVNQVYTSGGVITDPRNGSTHTDLDSFVFEKIEQIRAEITSIANNSTWSGAFGTARSAWQSMQKKIYDEKIHAAKTDLHLSDRNNDSETAYDFVTGMVERAAKTDIIAILEGMANTAAEDGDHYGEYWQALIAESKNRNVAQQYDIRWRGEDQEEFTLL